MNIEEVREFCLSMRGTTESFPFDEENLVFKVENKMYLLMPLNAEEPTISVKCCPELTEDLRLRYRAVTPAYHFNKKYWNSILLEEDMPSHEIIHWIEHSYSEVIAKLPKKIREQYLLK